MTTNSKTVQGTLTYTPTDVTFTGLEPGSVPCRMFVNASGNVELVSEYEDYSVTKTWIPLKDRKTELAKVKYCLE
jgi:hypothetical protein